MKIVIMVSLLFLLTGSVFATGQVLKQNVKAIENSNVPEKEYVFPSYNINSLSYTSEQIDSPVVYILYDENNIPIKLAAQNTYFLMRLAYPYIELKPVSDLNGLVTGLRSRPEVAVLIFNSTTSDVFVGEDTISWEDFAYTISEFHDTELIITLGNTYKLDEFKLRNWHYGVYEYTGLTSIIIYSAWMLADYLNNTGEQEASKKLKAYSIKTMAENLDLIFKDNVQPSVRLGVKDEERSTKALENYLSMHPNTMYFSKIIPEGAEDSDPPVLIGFKGLTPFSDGGGFDLMELPLLSGLKGPAGEFVDKVLKFLIGEGASVLSLDSSFVNAVLNAYSTVKELIGDPSKLGDGSLLKSFLKTIAKQIPILANYTKYLDVIIDGFFALRGSFTEIVNFLFTLIETFLPENSTKLAALVNTVKIMFNIGADIADEIGKTTDKTVDVILKIVMQKVANKTLFAAINETLKDDPDLKDKVYQIYNNVTVIAGLAIDFLTIKNATDFVDKLYDAVVNKLKLIDDPNLASTMDKVRNVIKLVIIVAQKGEINFKQLLKSVIFSFIPQSYISDVENLVKDLTKEISDAIKLAKTDLIAFGNKIKTILDTYISDASSLVTKGKEHIKNITTFIGALVNPTFNISDVDSLLELLERVLDDYLQNTSPLSIKLDDGTEVKALPNPKKLIKIIKATIIPLVKYIKNSKLYEAVQKAQEIDFSKPHEEILTSILDVVELVIEEFSPGYNFTSIREKIEYGGKIVVGILDVIGESKESPYPSLLRTVIMVGGYALKEIFGVNISIGNITKFLEAVLPRQMGLDRDPNYEEAFRIVHEALGDLISDPDVKNTVDTLLDAMLSIKQLYDNGIDWLVTKVLEWIASKINEFVSDLISQLEDLVNSFAFLNINGDTNIGIGGVDALTFKYNITLAANFEFDKTFIANDIRDLVVKGKYQVLDPIRQFENLLKAITIAPTFEASFELKSMFSDDNELMQKVIQTLGVSINVEGEARIKLIIFSFRSGSFNTSSFLELVDWYFRFGVEISKEFTLLDLFGAGSLNAIAQYIGLDAIKIILSLGFALEIAKGTGSSSGGDITTLTLEISIAGTLHIGLDVVVAKLIIDMTLKIIFRFLFNPVDPSPVRFSVDVTYKIKVEVELFFIGDTFEFGGTIFHYEFPNPNDSVGDLVAGLDEDKDGLSDKFEKSNFGLAVDRKDTDGDGLDDNEEMNGYGTDPLDPDTDSDGLNDYEEIKIIKTNPFVADTDNDKLTDYQEVKIYKTNPKEVDTDADGLDDYFEVTTVWDTSQVTISITGVVIGGKVYYDHTDPLNPDTDGDGLLDGQEGPMGGYYGDALKKFGDNPIIFNGGYTHPLDNDTDDDSFVQLADGRIADPKTFLISMTDKEEIDGITVVFIVDGEPELRTFRTSPVSPDTDQDTGAGGVFLNSDGYELSLDPPSDPLDGDTDDDGLIDGDEGIQSPLSNKTHYLLPDTDYDGLGDLQEVLMNLDPRNPDSDYDMVSDGDEYLKYGTNPLLPDSDFDNLLDGEELFYWHTNPMLKDSDNDGLTDGDEVLIYFTNPMDEDTDNDNLTDTEEIFIHETNPFTADSDYDGVIDGEEIYLYGTNPLDWDSDDDSILYPNEYGQYTWSMGDGEEIFKYGTDPLLSDTDQDGITDAFELYLASGLIPDFDPIYLNPFDNDTDNDGLLDGAELRLKEEFDIIYPYVSYNISYPLNSSPLLYDTDGDGLNDYLEIVNYTTMANYNDTDGDNLTDYDEIFTYNTSPLNPDTDFDNISDYDEIFGISNTTSNTSIANDIRTMVEYYLNPNDPDTDGDNLPDGYELYTLGSDPALSDSDGDGIPDGNEFDTDEDGLSDGDEFRLIVNILGTDAPFNPDSDNDGLNDGDEVHIYGTDPTNPDTDGDGYSDGAEVAAGTNPNEYTSEDDYNAVIGEKRAGYTLVILTPQGEIKDKFIDVRVLNSTPMETVWFRFAKEGSPFSENFTMSYDNSSQQWVYGNITWEEGSYTIQAFGKTPNGKVYLYETIFTIGEIKKGIDTTWLLIGLVIGVVATFFVIFALPVILRKRKKEDVKIEN